MTNKTNAKPTIAIDIDDVLFPFIVGIAEFHNDLRGTNLAPEDFFSFNFKDVWGGSDEEASKIVDSFLSKDSLHLKPVVGSHEALDKLKQDYKVVLVTARNGAFRGETSHWLRSHFPDLFDDLVFAGNRYDGRNHRSKGEICKELGAVLLIDDHPDNILSAAQNGIDGVLFGNKPWSVMNDNLIALSVKPCADWSQVEEYIYGEWRNKRLSK